MPRLDINRIIHACCPPVLAPYLARLEASEIGWRLAKGTFWTLAGTVLSRGLMLAATILVARILGKTGYGELGMIQTTIGMFGIFTGLGLGLTATKHVAEFRLGDPERAGRIIGLSGMVALAVGGMMTIILFIIAPYIADHTINAPHLSNTLRIGVMILFVNALNEAQTGALSGFEAFRTIAYVNIFVGIISFPILVSGAYFGGLNGAVWALAVNLGVNWLLNHLALRGEIRRSGIPFTFKGCGRELPVLWKFSLPAVLGGVLVGPVNWACAALLVNQPGGYAEMGIFNVASQWQVAVLFIPGMLGQVILPLLSNLNTSSTADQFRKLLKLNVLLNTGIALAVVIPLALSAHLIMSAYGPGFERGGERVLIVLAFTAVLMAINKVIGQAITSKGLMWVGFVFNALWAVVMLTASCIMISRGHGALGLAYATLTAYTLHTVWQAVYIGRVLVKGE